MTLDPSRVRVDLSFAMAGSTVPLDHGYALFGALCRVLGNLHAADWIAIHPIVGVPRTDGTLALHHHRGELRIRVAPAEIPRVLPLAGQTLELDGHRALVGTCQIHAIKPAPLLAARMVTIKGFCEESTFRDAAQRQLDALGVRARIEVKRRRVLTVNGDRVVGFATVLHEVSDEHSLAVQYVGLGGRQRMGCGVFVPAREQSES